MEVKVKKLTDVELLREANSFTTGHESHMTLATAYRCMHSNIRTQLFFVTIKDAPLFCCSQFVRSHVGVQFFQRSKRPDRGGEDFNDVCRNIAFKVRTAHVPDKDVSEVALVNQIAAAEIDQLPERFDRLAPTDLAFIINSEAIINMSKKRLCSKASAETREIWQSVVAEIEKVDPDLAKHCVKPCVACGGICREKPSCGFNKTELFSKILTEYKKLFV